MTRRKLWTVKENRVLATTILGHPSNMLGRDNAKILGERFDRTPHAVETQAYNMKFTSPEGPEVCKEYLKNTKGVADIEDLQRRVNKQMKKQKQQNQRKKLHQRIYKTKKKSVFDRIKEVFTSKQKQCEHVVYKPTKSLSHDGVLQITKSELKEASEALESSGAYAIGIPFNKR